LAQENIARGILWMLATMCLFTAMDALAKYLVQDYALVQVVWARFFFHMLWLLVILRAAILPLIRSANLKLQLLRSACLLLTTVLFFSGLETTPLATASTIMFLSPILVTVLAIPLLGEQVGLRRWLGVCTGFIGALIIVRPDASGVAIGHLFLIAAAFSNSLYQIVTRQVRAHDQAMTSLFYSGVVGAVLTSTAVPGYWTMPDWSGWLLFAAVGLLGALSHFCLIRAFRIAPASSVVPFSYSSLLWATLFGYLLFDALPDRWTLAGAALIVASGLYIYHREHLQQAKLEPESR
jgi:drug/metabolite transporter (DMT)-like permease